MYYISCFLVVLGIVVLNVRIYILRREGFLVAYEKSLHRCKRLEGIGFTAPNKARFNLPLHLRI